MAPEVERVEPAGAAVLEPADDAGSPVGLFVLTAMLGLLILLDLLTRGAPLPLPGVSWRPALLAAVIGGTRVTFASLSGALQGEIGADLALAIATWAALYVGEPLAAAEVVFIAMTGESLEAIAFARTSRALERLLSLWPRTARVLVDGEEHEVPSDEVQAGQVVVVRPGERLPVDGVVVLGETSLDQSTLTGESVPVDRRVGDPVFSGTQNLYGAIQVRAERVGGETTIAQVVALVREAEQRKAPVQRTADLYAAYFLPVVLLIAGATFLLSRDWMRTVAVLVVACPCALVLATPAAVLAGIGRLARLGVLVKSGEALESLARVDTVVFDKTGTLTLARLELGDVVPFGGASAGEVLAAAAAAEAGSEHPLAATLVAAARERGLNWPAATSVEARPGAGVVAQTSAGRVAVGNLRLLEELGLAVDAEALGAVDTLAADGQTAVLVAADDRLLGVVGARDQVRADAAEAVSALAGLGVRRLALLTGDREPVAQAVARQVGIAEVLAEQLPGDKAEWVRARQNAGERVAMVGDGVNDAPGLAQANVGVAVAETGADLAAEAADVVLLGDPMAQLPPLVRLSRQVLATIRLSILGFAFGLNGLAVLLSALGKLTPVQAAVFHQVGSLAVLLNALRLLGFEPRPESLVSRAGARLAGAVQAVLSVDIDAGVGWLAERWRWLLKAGAVTLLALWLLSCLVLIGPDQVAVVRVLGRPTGTYGPGVAVKPWWPLGRAARLRPGEVRSLELGFRSQRTRSGARPVAQPGLYDWNSAHQAGVYTRMPDEAVMLTGDENYVEVTAVIHYTVRDAQRHLFAVADPAALLRSDAEAAVRDTVAELPLDEVLTARRHEVEEQVRARLQPLADRHGLGVRVMAVELADVHPPLEVVPAFRAVATAYENKEQRINEAEAYHGEQVPLARGEAAARRQAARAYRYRRAERARGDASRFRARAEAARAGMGVTRARLQMEATERALAGRRKMVLDPTVAARRQFWLLGGDVAAALRVLGSAAPAPPSEVPPPPADAAPPAPSAGAPPAEDGPTPNGAPAPVEGGAPSWSRVQPGEDLSRPPEGGAAGTAADSVGGTQ